MPGFGLYSGARTLALPQGPECSTPTSSFLMLTFLLILPSIKACSVESKFSSSLDLVNSSLQLTRLEEAINFDTKDQLLTFNCAFDPDKKDKKEPNKVAETSSTCLNMHRVASLSGSDSVKDRLQHLLFKSLKDLEVDFFDIFLDARYFADSFTSSDSLPRLRRGTDCRSYACSFVFSKTSLAIHKHQGNTEKNSVAYPPGPCGYRGIAAIECEAAQVEHPQRSADHGAPRVCGSVLKMMMAWWPCKKMLASGRALQCRERAGWASMAS